MLAKEGEKSVPRLRARVCPLSKVYSSFFLLECNWNAVLVAQTSESRKIKAGKTREARGEKKEQKKSHARSRSIVDIKCSTLFSLSLFPLSRTCSAAVLDRVAAPGVRG